MNLKLQQLSRLRAWGPIPQTTGTCGYVGEGMGNN